MPSAALFVQPADFVNGIGTPYAFGKLYFYATGTSTPQATYTSSALTVGNTNPVVADINGQWPDIYLPASSSYKPILKTSADVTVRTWDPVQGISISATPSVGLLRSYLAGLTLSRNVGTPNTKIDVAAGARADSTNVLAMLVSAGTIDCGTVGVNGLDVGSLANSTWYHAFAIAKVDGTIALLASTSATSPALPSGYTLSRRLGSFKTDGSAHFLAFIKDGDLFQWVTTPIQDANTGGSQGTSAITQTLASVPTGGNVLARFQFISGNSGSATGVTAYLSDLATTDVAPTQAGTFIGDSPSAATTAGSVSLVQLRMEVRTNTSGQIRIRLSASNANISYGINTLGWVDRRGRGRLI